MRISDWSSDVCSSDLFSRLGVPSLSRAVGSPKRNKLTLLSIAEMFRANGMTARTDASDTGRARRGKRVRGSEEQTSELQSLMRISSAVFCLKKKQNYKPKRSESASTTTQQNKP